MRRLRVMDLLQVRPRSGFVSLFLAASMLVAAGCSTDSSVDNTVRTPPGTKPPEEIQIKPNVAPKKGSAKAEPI